VLAVLGAVFPAHAVAGPRLYVGLFDDQAFRWQANRHANLDLAEADGASVIRTIVTWSVIAPRRPREPADPFAREYRFNDLDDRNAFFILGRDGAGEVVACQAGRLYQWDNSNFKEECESLRMFYRDPEAGMLPGEEWTVTALGARGASGRVAFSGAAWYRRDFRGVGLVEWLPRLSRALAKGLWDTDVTVTVMAENNVKRGVFPRNGYRNGEWAVEAINGRMGTLRYAFLWSKSDEMVEDLEEFLGNQVPERDAALRAVSGE